MNPCLKKKSVLLLLLICFLICALPACKKHGLIPHNTTSTDSTANDSTIAAQNAPTFDSPTGLAMDAAGNIYVADYGNNEIRKIATDGTVSTIAGNGTQGSVNASDTLATFNGPAGVAADNQGNLYVADSGNNLIRQINPARLVTTLAGGDTTGFAINGTGVNASFFDPLAVAVDASGNIYVADAGDNAIRKVTSAGVVTTFAQNNSADSTTASIFVNPSGVALDGSGNIFVAGYLTNSIVKVTQAGAASVFAGTGQPGSANGAGSTASFYFPNSVATDAAGNVYVADGVNNLIRKITTDGSVSTLAGSGAAGAADSTGTAASFDGPAGLVVDATGNVYVADSNNNLIRKITPLGVVSTIAGNGQPGNRNGKAFAYRNKKATTLVAKTRFNQLRKTKANWLHKTVADKIL